MSDRDILADIIGEAYGSCSSNEEMADAILAEGWTVTMPELSMIPDALYRNSMGAELWAVAHVNRKVAAQMLYATDPLVAAVRAQNPFGSGGAMVFGSLWVMESRDELFGTYLHLATPEGLMECGFVLVSQPEEEDDDE